MLPDGRKRSIDVRRLDIEISDEKAAFGIEGVGGSFDQAVERELLAVFGGGIVRVDVVEDVASVERCSCVLARRFLLVLSEAV